MASFNMSLLGNENNDSKRSWLFSTKAFKQHLFHHWTTLSNEIILWNISVIEISCYFCPSREVYWYTSSTKFFATNFEQFSFPVPVHGNHFLQPVNNISKLKLAILSKKKIYATHASIRKISCITVFQRYPRNEL